MKNPDFLSDLRTEIKRASFFPLILRLSLVALRHKKSSFPPGFFVSGSFFNFGHKNACLSLWRRLRNRKSETDTADIFSGDFYLACNRDVEQAGWNPWLHYQMLGRFEGRSPHPLINPRFLANELKVGISDAVDLYLSNEKNWFVAPSEYVDVWGFLRAGNSDGIRNPFVQMLEDGFVIEPWVSQRLQIINLSLTKADSFQLEALAVIHSLNGARALWDEIRTIPRNDVRSAEELSRTSIYCIPGYGLFGESGTYLPCNSTLISPDKSTIVGPDKVIFIATEEKSMQSGLVFMTGNMSIENLDSVVRKLTKNSLVAPSSSVQEQVLRCLKLQINSEMEILPYGLQVAINPTEIIQVDGENHFNERVWHAGKIVSVDFSKVSILLSKDESEKSLTDPKTMELLSRGAHLCIVDTDALYPWLPTLWRSETIFFGDDARRWASSVRDSTKCFPLNRVQEILL